MASSELPAARWPHSTPFEDLDISRSDKEFLKFPTDLQVRLKFSPVDEPGSDEDPLSPTLPSARRSYEEDKAEIYYEELDPRSGEELLVQECLTQEEDYSTVTAYDSKAETPCPQPSAPRDSFEDNSD